MSTPGRAGMEWSSPAEAIAGNDDLLSEILSFVPLKPLLQLKSVNKQWHFLISSPSFCLLHSIRHLHRPSSALFFLRHNHHHHHRHPFPSPSSPSFDFIPLLHLSTHTPPPFLSLLNSNPIDIIQSCNGLLLCSHARIFNPTTNQMSQVPLPPRSFLLGVSLAFDLSRSPHYRLLCVWKLNDQQNLFSIDLYHPSIREWRPVVSCFSAPFDVEFDRGVYCDGRMYWLSHTHSTVAFNLDEECIENLTLPKPIEGAYIERFRYFGESCGHLHLIEIRTNCVPDFEVLELDRRRRDNMVWVVKYKVNLDVVGRGFEAEMFLNHSDRFGRPLRFYAFSILAVIRDTENDGDCGFDPQLVLSVPDTHTSTHIRYPHCRVLFLVIDLGFECPHQFWIKMVITPPFSIHFSFGPGSLFLLEGMGTVSSARKHVEKGQCR